MSQLLEELNNLIELQKMDIAIGELEQRINGIPVEIDKINEQLKQSKTKLEAEKGLLQRLQIELKNKNLELETIEQTIKKHMIELNLVKTNQAYRALQDEIDTNKKQKDKYEDEILSLLEQIDAQTKKYADSTESLKKEELQSQEIIKSLESESQKLSQTLAEKKSARIALASKISQNLISKYNFLITKKNNIAIVPLEGQACGGCHMKISYQNLNELYHLYHEESETRSLVTCENCSRILYLPDGPPQK